MAIVLVFSVAVPAAMAEEEPAGSGLEGLLDEIRSAIGEDVSSNENVVERILKKILLWIQKEADERGITVEELLDQALASITGEDGKIDIIALIGMIGSNLGLGNSDLAEPAEEAADGEDGGLNVLQLLRERNAAIDAYIIDEYKDQTEPGDVQVVYQYILMSKDEDPCINLGYFEMQNYVPEGKDLKFKNSAGGVEYLVFTYDESLKCELVEVIKPEEGEGYEASIDMLCEKYGITREAFESVYTERDYYESLCVYTFMQNHPEYERIEYRGEFRTVEEMGEIWSASMDVYFDSLF